MGGLINNAQNISTATQNTSQKVNDINKKVDSVAKTVTMSPEVIAAYNATPGNIPIPTGNPQMGASQTAPSPTSTVSPAMKKPLPAITPPPPAQPKTVGGFIQNVGSGLKETANGILNIPKTVIDEAKSEIAHGQVPNGSNLLANLALKTGKGMITSINQDLGDPLKGGDVLGRIVDNAYNRPVQTALDVMPVIGAAKDISALGKAGEVGEAAGVVTKTNKVSSALKSTADKINGKVDPSVFTSVVKPSPNYMNDLAKISKTAEDYGLMDGSTEQALHKMPTVMDDIGKQIKTSLAQNKNPVDLNASATAYEDFAKKNYDQNTGTPAYDKAIETQANRIKQINGDGKPATPILDASGKEITPTRAPATAADLYELKSQLGGELSKVFDRQARGSDVLSPTEEAKMALWDNLKQQLDVVAPEVRDLNNTQHSMYDIAKGLSKDYIKNSKGKAPISLTNVFELMANPGIFVADKVLSSNMGKSAIAGGLNKAADVVSGNSATLKVPPIGKVAAKTGVVANQLSPSQGGIQTVNGDKTQNQDTHTINIPQNGAVSQDQKGHLILAPLQPKTVPQDYSTEQYMSEKQALQSSLDDPVNFYNPQNKEQIMNKMKLLDTKYAASRDNAQKGIEAAGLAPEDKSFMDHAQQSAYSLDQANDLIKKVGTSPLYANKTIKYFRDQHDPEAAKLDALLSRLSQLSEKSAVGGRLSNFDIMLGSSFLPKPDDTPAAAIAKLDQAKEMLASEYSNFYPKYGLTVGNNNTVPSIK